MIAWIGRQSKFTEWWMRESGDELSAEVRYVPDFAALVAEGGDEYARVVIAEHAVPLREFAEWMDERPVSERGRWLVLLDGIGWRKERPELLRACRRLGIATFEPWVQANPVEQLRSLLFGAEPQVRSNRIVFCGTTPNIGTTATASAFAVRLAASGRCSVVYACLNLKSSKLHRYFNVPAQRTLDHLSSDMRAGTLDWTAVESAVAKPIPDLDRLHLLIGNQQREQAELYTADGCKALLDLLSQRYDVVIADVNAYWDNPATLAAMEDADWRILVTTPEPSHALEDWQMWLHRLQSFYQLDVGDADLVLTQVLPSAGGCTSTDIRRRFGRHPIASIGFMPELRKWLAEGTLGIALRDGALADETEPLLAACAERFGLSLQRSDQLLPAQRLRRLWRRTKIRA